MNAHMSLACVFELFGSITGCLKQLQLDFLYNGEEVCQYTATDMSQLQTNAIRRCLNTASVSEQQYTVV